MSQTKIILLVALVAIVYVSQASAQTVDLSKCQEKVTEAARELIQKNQELLRELQKKITSKLSGSLSKQGESVNKLIRDIQTQLSGLTENLSSIDIQKLLDTFTKIGSLQGQILELLTENPSLFVALYSDYLNYLVKANTESISILLQIPSGCEVTRKKMNPVY